MNKKISVGDGAISDGIDSILKDMKNSLRVLSADDLSKKRISSYEYLI